MSRPLVAGIGSPFGADRTGWQAVEAWREGLGAGCFEAVECVLWDRPGTALLPEVAERPQVVLVDALAGGGEPGTVHRFTEVGPLRMDYQPLSSHGVGLAEALSLAQALGELPERWSVLAIAADPDGDVPPLAAASAAIEVELADA